MYILCSNITNVGNLFIVEDYISYMGESNVDKGKTRCLLASVVDDDITVNESAGVLALSKLAILGAVDILMIDYSNVSPVYNELMNDIDAKIHSLLEKEGYVDTKSYENRWSFCKIPLHLR